MGVTERNSLILISFMLDHSTAMKSYGELMRTMESYGKKVHIKFLKKGFHKSYKELWRAMESYGELLRAMGKTYYLTI